jgi:hypothetical protein
MRIHRLIVALNASERCRAHFGGRGSLVIDNTPSGRVEKVFSVRPRDFPKGFVHVLDDVSLDVVLSELDTISDFVGYLRAKQAVLEAGVIAEARGEEDLLGFYLRNINDSGQHAFVMPASAHGVTLVEGFWESFAASQEYAAKKRADGPSYLWDTLIERFSKNLSQGTILDPAEVGFAEIEHSVRIMATEPRLMRRVLGNRLVQKLGATGPDQIGTTALIAPGPGSVAYAFLLMPMRSHHKTYEEYREDRHSVLSLYCYLVKLEHPHVGRVLGIATEPTGSHGSSEDLVLLTIESIPPDEERKLRELQRASGLIITPKDQAKNVHVEEYPVAEPVQAELLRQAVPPKPRTKEGQHDKKNRAKKKQAKAARRKNR